MKNLYIFNVSWIVLWTIERNSEDISDNLENYQQKNCFIILLLIYETIQKY